MKCDKCKRETEKAFLVSEGSVCPDCCEEIVKRGNSLVEELANEPLDQAPEEMDVAAFHRWTLKLAVQTLQALSPTLRARMLKRNPVMLYPYDLACHLNGLILDCMSRDEFKSRKTGQRKGQFWFGKRVKFASVKRAAFEARVITDLRKTH
jgi:hypothetical protein